MYNGLSLIQRIVVLTVSFLIALTVHEFAHARAALSAGDDTAKRAGRVTLNPISHLDPVGTVLFVLTAISGFGIAWGKPVPVNPELFRNPRWDNLKVSLWGPLSNIITAAIFGLLLRFVADAVPTNYGILLFSIVEFNLVLAFFNLIPIYPLDGSHIIMSLLSPKKARGFGIFMARYGMILILVIAFTRIASMLITPPVLLLSQLFMGPSAWMHFFG
jgi:Zn-dependent protease